MTRTIIIAGTRSGCGKTTVSLALMAALSHRGLVVQSFKAGPDFIDPGLHQLVTGRAAHNLDGWMLGEGGVREVFSRYAQGVDVAVVEGVMGLYDGFSGVDEAGSTAQLAKWLGAPVLLVADARSMARSAAAMVRGYVDFDPDVNFAGVVFNGVGSASHAQLLDEAMTQVDGVNLLGCLGRDEGVQLPSRHLGLVTADDARKVFDGGLPNRLASWFESGVNVGQLALTLPEEEIVSLQVSVESERPVDGGFRARVGVALDEAFCFYYHENFRHLIEAGAELVFFSPLRDEVLPEGLDGLYLGGGYPELHARMLSANESMRHSVHAFARGGGVVYAECGGFMYLMHELETMEGPFPMCGVFAMRCAMAEKFRALGYREAVIKKRGMLGEAWTMARGHEFHYSHIVEEDPDVEPVYRVQTRTGWSDQKEGFTRENVLGSYIHLHFGSNPEVPRAFVDACARTRGEADGGSGAGENI